MVNRLEANEKQSIRLSVLSSGLVFGSTKDKTNNFESCFRLSSDQRCIGSREKRAADLTRVDTCLAHILDVGFSAYQ